MKGTPKQLRDQAVHEFWELSQVLGIDDPEAKLSVSRDPVFDLQWININNNINSAILSANTIAYARLVDRREVILLSKFQLPREYWEERQRIVQTYDKLINEALKKGNNYMLELYTYEKYKQIEILQDRFVRKIYPLMVEIREVTFE